jgi:superfamily II DNA or RNA helicase
VHNLGASRIRELLPEKIRFRLGLSATPERHRDEEGTAAIFDYFGGVVFEYGIRQAIKDKILCPYHYHPVVVDLTDEEGEEYWRLTQEIGRKFPRDEDSDLPDVVKMLLIRRARLLASCANKLPALSAALDGLDNKVSKAMIYCGDGRVEDLASEDEALIRQVDAAVRLLGNSHKLIVRRFTCSEPMSEREDILNHLRDGSLDAVVAIRCLDEGIDVPDVRMGFLLASSTNPRQFIQRRGRLLRRAEGKTHAEIWDFIVRPPDMGGKVDAETFNLERKLFARELARVVDFCQTAENGDSALGLLADLRRRYNLLAN